MANHRNVFSHISIWGTGTVRNFHTMIFQPYGEIGTDIFVMISGYFLCKQRPTIEKTFFRVSRIWLRTIFYSWLILLIFVVFKISKLNIWNILSALLPVSFNEYWFITDFILLMILVPVLNQVLIHLSPRQIIASIIVLVFISGVMPLYVGFTPFGGYLNIGIMIASYMFAGYTRIYLKDFSIWLFISVFLLGLSIQYISIYFFKNQMVTYGALPYVSAAALFPIIVRSKSFFSPIINRLAMSVFATYLITTHPLVVPVLWGNLMFRAEAHFNLVIAGILSALLLLIVTVAIDQIYLIIERKFGGLKLCSVLSSKLARFIESN
jgi:hypothetical protein